ncbi:hypothetical protein L5876_04560 [Hyphobacterium sp. SN044]|uniref:hypothetical protein n=1 Tax=Hyphobacterium sp. SN044 TaxID=2912575 RepID=UPI001F41691B|nr:hypothetical protein [Hyphobacterium sp. SN044]MCF8879082.1 hypothetical protein [Hyphobacterium sp. SN044]
MKYVLMTAAALTALVGETAFAQSRSVDMSGIVVDWSGDVEGNGEFSAAAIDVNGTFGGNLILSGAAMDARAVVGGRLTADGGAIDFEGSVTGEAEFNAGAVEIEGDFGANVEINAGAADIRRGSTFAGDVEIAAGALDFSGRVEGRLTAEVGDAEFDGVAMGPIEINAERRRGMFNRRDRSEVTIAGQIEAGGTVCAHEVIFESGASVSGTLTVTADEAPDYPSGFDSSNVRFVERDGEECR